MLQLHDKKSLSNPDKGQYTNQGGSGSLSMLSTSGPQIHPEMTCLTFIIPQQG